MIFRRTRGFLLALAVCAAVRAADPAAAPTPPATAATSASAAPLVPTVIESGKAEMVSTEKETTFTFKDAVTVTATNMKLMCDELVVVARRSGDVAATIGKQEKFKSMLATGNVRIIQNDREATCGRAEVFPDEDKVVLTENPRVKVQGDDHIITGPRMELHRGERRAVILSDATARPTITLPALKDLGYDKEKPKAKKDAGKAAPAPSTESPAPPPSSVITVPGITPQPK
jgi:lipopolysaccharide export system protein LptA